LERILRDLRNGRLGDVPIPYAELEQLMCAEIVTARPLNLIDLRGDNLVKMGVPTDAVRASSHRLGQKWSLAFWLHEQRPHGILYYSRLNDEINMALYDVALPNMRVSTTRPLLEYRTEVAGLIREFKLAIV
jgi:RES domain